MPRIKNEVREFAQEIGAEEPEEGGRSSICSIGRQFVARICMASKFCPITQMQ